MSVNVTRLPFGPTVVSHRMDHLKSAALGIWVKAKSYPNVVANDFFSAEVYNCSQLCWQISNPQGTVGTAFRLRGFAKNAR